MALRAALTGLETSSRTLHFAICHGTEEKIVRFVPAIQTSTLLVSVSYQFKCLVILQNLGAKHHLTYLRVLTLPAAVFMLSSRSEHSDANVLTSAM